MSEAGWERRACSSGRSADRVSDPLLGAAPQGGRSAGGRRRELRPAARRDDGSGRRVRLGQVDAGPHGHRSGRRQARQRALRGRRAHRCRRVDATTTASRHADGLPGSVRLAQPAVDGGRDHHRRLAGQPRHRSQEPLGRGRWRAARAGRPQPRARRPVPAPVLRRPAPADRHRPGARAPAQARHLRRGGLGAGRVGAGADAQPPRRSAGRPRADVSVHRPRPVGGQAHLQRGAGDAPRPGRRAGPDAQLFDDPLHEYTRELLRAVPVVRPWRHAS